MTTTKPRQKLKIGTKSQAMAILRVNPKARTMAYCTGKYEWTGSAASHLGKEVETWSHTLAIWVERRQDADGAFAKMMCVTCA